MISAKQEFLKCGYEKASLRVICKNAGLTTGALYFFFSNKEELFDCLVEKVAGEFKKNILELSKIEKDNYRKDLNSKSSHDCNFDIEHEKEIMKYIYTNKDAFILLLKKARGSAYENYYRETVDFMEKMFKNFFELYNKENTDSYMVEYTMHCLVSWRINSYLEMLDQNLTLEEALFQSKIIASFAVGGWEKVIKYIT